MSEKRKIFILAAREVPLGTETSQRLICILGLLVFIHDLNSCSNVTVRLFFRYITISIYIGVSQDFMKLCNLIEEKKKLQVALLVSFSLIIVRSERRVRGRRRREKREGAKY